MSEHHSLLLVNPPASVATSLFYLMAYSVIALFIYTYATHQLSIEERPLQDRCTELHRNKENLKKQNQELSEMVASLGDPAADEYAIITELGRIPKGSVKILFSEVDKKTE
jgi:hypothetical protein